MRLGDPLTRERPADEREGHVEQHAREQHRHDQEESWMPSNRLAATPQHRQHEAAELAADVAHEDTGARIVERQEPPPARPRAERREIDEPAAMLLAR